MHFGSPRASFSMFFMMLAPTFEPKIANLAPTRRLNSWKKSAKICQDLQKICQDLPETIRNKMRAYNTPHRNHRPLNARTARISGAAVTAARHLQLNPPPPLGGRSVPNQNSRTDRLQSLSRLRTLCRASPKIPIGKLLGFKFQFFSDSSSTFCCLKNHLNVGSAQKAQKSQK